MQEKFRDFKAEPPAALWDKISAGLDQQPKKRLPYAWLAAAAVLLFAGIGLWLNAASPVDVQPEAQRAVLEPSAASAPAVEKNNKAQENTAVLTAVQSPGPKSQKVKLLAMVPQQVYAEVQPEARALPLQAQASNPAVPVQDELQQASLQAEPVQVLTSLPAEEISETAEAEAPAQRQRGGSIGRFVNKLVSKVDSREDKLIEVSEETGEGLKITGLNFGLVKMKNKYAK